MSVETVYVQKLYATGEFINETAFAMWEGCRLLGYHVEFFNEKSFDFIPLSKETLVHGWVGMVRRAWKHLGVEELRIDGEPPEVLRHFFGRKMWVTTMGEIRKLMDEDTHVFIKPKSAHKAFTGHVTSGKIADLIQTASFPDDFEVAASEVVNFVSEYRLLVHQHEIKGVRHYKGDFRVYPDLRVADKMIAAWKNNGAPVGYSLDLGVTESGETLPVELNDAFALGGYGQNAISYANLVIDRWEEIVGV